MQTPLVSIVIPIYNTATDLARCIESVRRQTYPNLEILLVNDGSSDTSLPICQMYARVDGRIAVLNRPNAGVSAARNAAIAQAKGEFLQFVDSDDYLAPQATEKLVEKAVGNQCDLVISHYYRVRGEAVTVHGFLETDRVLSQEEFARHPLHTGTIPFMPGMLKRVVPGSTDVGDVSYQVPTAQINTAAALIGTDAHTWQYTGQVGTGLGDRSAQAAARAIALACAAVYEDPSIAAKAKEELLEETGGQYNCPIPAELSYTDLIASQN